MRIFLSPQVKRSLLLLVNWYIRVVSRVAERLKAQDLKKLGKFRIMSKLHGSITQCPVFLPKIKFCQYQQKTSKQKLNFSRSALFHMKTRVFLKYFVRGCRSKHNSTNDSHYSHIHFELYALVFFSFAFQDFQNSVSWRSSFSLCFGL